MPDFGDERLDEIWEHFTDQLEDYDLSDYLENLSDDFIKGYIDREVDPEERAEAREDFENWLTEHMVDISDFDWDAWRDWYDE